MKSEIEEIKERANKINVDELIKTGKNVFDEQYESEFPYKNEAAFVLDKTYTCYANEDKLVLRSFKKESRNVNPDVVEKKDFTASANMIYIKGKEVKELSAPDSAVMVTSWKKGGSMEISTSEKDKLNEGDYKEAFDVIEAVTQRNIIQKQHIRNFFRRIFAGKNNNLLDGKATTLTAEEIKDMLAQIQEKQENFMDKYSTEKTDTDKVVDSMEKANEKNEQEIENEREEK